MTCMIESDQPACCYRPQGHWFQIIIHHRHQKSQHISSLSNSANSAAEKIVPFTCMVSVGVEVTAVEARVCVVLIQSLFLSEVDLRVLPPQPVAILHLPLPGHVYQLLKSHQRVTEISDRTDKTSRDSLQPKHTHTHAAPTWGSTNHLFSLPPPLLGWKR